jgi:hypothetical protein
MYVLSAVCMDPYARIRIFCCGFYYVTMVPLPEGGFTLAPDNLLLFSLPGAVGVSEPAQELVHPLKLDTCHWDKLGSRCDLSLSTGASSLILGSVIGQLLVNWKNIKRTTCNVHFKARKIMCLPPRQGSSEGLNGRSHFCSQMPLLGGMWNQIPNSIFKSGAKCAIERYSMLVLQPFLKLSPVFETWDFLLRKWNRIDSFRFQKWAIFATRIETFAQNWNSITSPFLKLKSPRIETHTKYYIQGSCSLWRTKFKTFLRLFKTF